MSNNKGVDKDNSTKKNNNESNKSNEKIEEELEKMQEEAIEDMEVKEEALTVEEQKKLMEERDEYYNKLLRLQAEFENYKKRIAGEREKDKKYGREQVMKGLLPILDNFERALENVGEEEREENEFYKGVKMIYEQLVEVLKQNGLERIEACGEKFDPNYHEAVMMVESEEHSKNIVVEELQCGYLLHDKLLRASKVKVCK